MSNSLHNLRHQIKKLVNNDHKLKDVYDLILEYKDIFDVEILDYPL